MIKYKNRKKNQIFKKSAALIVAGALLCSTILPPYAFAYRKGGMPFQTAKSAENHNVRDKSNLIGDIREARRVLLKESLPHGNPEILSNAIEELFVVPYREFLDTFDPIQFFKSHEQQTVGQAIGIVLIWGAMVATMIGAPFGVDFLLSGNSTAHIGHDLIASLIGSLSILAGTILNQIKEKEVQLSEIKTNRELVNELGQDREKINRFIQSASHLKELVQNHNFNRTQKIILSVAYLSYPPNFLAHHLYNLISNLTRPFGKRGLAPLTKGVKVYYWDTREQGIENVREILKRYRPGIMERYDDLENLQPFEIKRLRNDIYKITYGHFQVWGLSRARKQSAAPYFHGSYKEALKAVFPNLELKPLGFQLDWSSLEKAIETLRYVLSQEIPSIIERYDKINRLTSQEIDDLRDDIYKITYGHFQAWGLGSALQQDYFNRSYIEALDKVFTDLELSPLGFQLDWSSRDKAVESIKYALSRKAPHIMQQYARLDHLSARELHDLRNEIYEITYGHFQVWGIVRAMDIPYFNGNYMDALIAVFNDPRVGLSKYEFENFRRQTTVVRYSWKSGREGAISNFRDALQKNMPDLLEQYENLYKLSQHEVELLKKNIYSITQGHFNIWGLSTALSQRDVPYFHGSFVEALIPLFPDLELNPLGFRLDWSTKERAVESFRYILSQEVPFIIERYENLNNLSPREINDLRSDIYKITSLDFQLWGLGSVSSQKAVPFFHGSYIEALIALFPDLKLNPLGFKLDWSSKENAINSVRYTLAQEYPGLVERYDQLNQLSLQEANDLKDDIYKISNGHFLVWGLSNALHIKDVPYFDGSYVNVLIALFSDLGLTREGFLQKSGSNGAALTTESTHSEALKRGMNPDGWITQLFFAPHYEFLDTFSPVWFFKSHREQTLSQVIGIVMIWGAMVATMIGAPFGIDYLLSGSSTAHLGITFISSVIGSLSILSGIILNQIKEKEVQFNKLETNRELINELRQDREKINRFIQSASNLKELVQNYHLNRAQKIILSIAYLSYPVNFLTHHLYNLISNLTRPLGKQRLAPLTRARAGEDQYQWTTREQGIKNVKEVIRKNRPDLLERYKELSHLSPLESEVERESLRNEIYEITKGHLDVWGLSAVSKKKFVPYFQGNFTVALMVVFPDLDINPLGFQLDWSSRENGIESIRFVLTKEVPNLMQQYAKLDQIDERERENLRDEIYRITSGQFNVWGLSKTMDSKITPYFNGSYVNALVAVFPDLNLNPLGFELKWMNENRQPDINVGVESVRFVLTREFPHIMQQYARLPEMNDREIQYLRNAIYGIKQAHFQAWGLNRALVQETVPYFGGSYQTALLSVFDNPRLGLTMQGFKDYRKANWERNYSWVTPDSGIWSVREAIRSNRPDILARYENLGNLSEGEINELRRDIYGITKGHFNVWGLGAAMNRQLAPYFHGSYIDALIAVFPDLRLNPLGFQLKWAGEDGEPDIHVGIESVRFVLSKVRPHLIVQYDNRHYLNQKHLQHLRSEIYKITQGYFKIWGLGSALNQEMAPYFNGSHMKVLMAVFPDLHLNPLGFQLKWENEDGKPDIHVGIESVRFILSRKVPHILQQYERLDQLDDRERENLRDEIYRITSGHFQLWGLGRALAQRSAPYFHGKHQDAMMAVFSDLDLNHLGFQLKWENEDGKPDIKVGIESVRFVLFREVPHIMQKYERLDQLDHREQENLRDEIYQITSGHFKGWGLNVAMNTQLAPYFYGSHVNVLMAVFSDLDLKPLGFRLDWSNEERGIDTMKFILYNKIPQIMQAYERLDQLSDLEISNLKNNIYSIRQRDLQAWKLGAAMNQEFAPYFHGSYIVAMLKVFSHPKLALTREGFSRKSGSRVDPLTTEFTRSEAVRRGINPNNWITQLFFAPHYEFLDTFDPVRFFKSHREQTVGQAIGIVLIWGAMVAAMIGAPFGVDYLLSGSPTTHLGVTIIGSGIGALSILAGIILNQIKEKEVQYLNRIQKLILSIVYLSYPPNFFAHHLYNLISNLTRPLGRWRFVPLTKGVQVYYWDTREQGIENVREVIRKNRPDLLERYEELSHLPSLEREGEQESLRNEIYGITKGHFDVWGLISVSNKKQVPYFQGSFIFALMAVFPDLNLNPLGFWLDWSNEEKAIESVRYVLWIEIPHIMQQYEKLNQLTDIEAHQLRDAIYEIKAGHLNVWGLSNAINRKVSPYFHGNYSNVLIAVFPELNLHPLGFQLDWSSKKKEIESVRFVLIREAPDLIGRYENLVHLSRQEREDEAELLRNKIYKISKGHFMVWGLGGGLKYFKSYIKALQEVFPDLNLDPLGFQLDWSNREKAIQSIQYVLNRQIPHLILQYDRLSTLNSFEIEELKNAIYRINRGLFRSWGFGERGYSLYFSGHIDILIEFFSKLNLNPLGFQLDWTIKEKAIESIRYVLAREAPFIMEQYARIGKLGAREIQELRNRIYGIKQAHFSLWGLSGAIDTRVLPDFQGNYRQVLLAIFNNSKLGLTLQGFSDHRRSTYERRYVWKSLESGLWNVREAIRANRPDILERYENLSQLNEKEIKKLIVDIYGISAAHFNVWGVGGALVQRIAPYFNGSYIKALMMLFPDLELNRLGFRLDWTTKEKGIESVRYVLNQFRPDLIQRYNNRHHLNHYQLDILINEIYNISSNHFDSWGLNSVMDRHKTEYFNGSYIKALTLVFPDLDINPLGFQLDWSSPEKGIESVKYVLNQEIPHIMQQYERLDRINESDIRSLKKEIYRITYGHFALWGLSEAMNRKKAPYFYGSYVNVLMAVFPDLNLNSLGFGLKWENENGKSDINVGIESVKYVLNQEIPHIMHQYERLDRSKERDLRNLRNKIYAITAFDFEIWGLGAALNWQLAPYFYGSHVNILMAVFPDLDMNPLGFRLDWSSRQKGIESVKYVLSHEVPHIIRQYERIDHLTDRELQDLRNAIYGITQGHFTLWGLGAARIPQTASYFKGTHIDALLEVFSHPKLGLTREAFSRKSGSSVDPLTTESTRSEAVRRGINPNNWITQLFFAPHYEFLDTFDPVRFFKSHREQTVGQAIGIVLIWGAMVAAMIGAPFGVDYLLSGSPTAHLGVTIIISAIGAFSILAGMRLNQIKEKEVQFSELEINKELVNEFRQDREKINSLIQSASHLKELVQNYHLNRARKIIFSIAYLSYPVNFLTHHLYNLISNFTRPLGKWRLAPLTKGANIYKWENKEQGIENVKDILKRYRPGVVERYNDLENLQPLEIKRLKNDIYKITKGHFQVWGLSRAMSVSYFYGSYTEALRAVFPNLELNTLGFQLDWSSLEKAIETLRYVLSQEYPSIIERYDNLNRLTSQGIDDLIDDIYRITYGHFQGWGLGSALKQDYFNGSYIEALDKVFPDLELNPLGFQLNWSSEEKAVESIKYALSREAPHIMQQYARLDRLSARDVHDLRNEIYGITKGHFQVWGLARALDIPYFNRSYMDALITVFNDPRLELSKLEFENFRRKTTVVRYSWKLGREGAINNVRDALQRNRPDLLEQYENLDRLAEHEVELLKKSIYRISQGHFSIWGVSNALIQGHVPYFHGSYSEALMALFQNLELNPLGFRLDWSTKERAIESLRYVLSQEIPFIIERYKKIDGLTPREIQDIRNELYKITSLDFQLYGLGSVLIQKAVPYFHGSYIEALLALFPNLELNPLGFQLDWSSEENAINSIRYTLAHEYPGLIEKYNDLDRLPLQEVNELKNDIYKITNGHFQVWGLNNALHPKDVPYFNGSYGDVLLKVFPKLNLNPLGFRLDWSSEEKGIESIEFVFEKEMPHLMQQYRIINELDEIEIQRLRDIIYGITFKDFDVFGIGAAKNRSLVPYFEGSYINVLLAVFSDPKLGLVRKGFVKKHGNGGAVLMTEATRSEAVKQGMNPDGWIAQLFFAPHYEFLNTFDPVRFFKSHREQTIGQAIGIVLIWGVMIATMIGAPFGVDYLLSGSPAVHLGYDLLASLIGALSIISGIQLNKLKQNKVQLNEIKQDIIHLNTFIQTAYKINRTQKLILSIAYFSYPINFLTHHLYNLISNFTRALGKWRLAPLTQYNGTAKTELYHWGTEEQGLENVRDAIKKNRPDIVERYDLLDRLLSKEREDEEKFLRDEIYRITSGHFKVWGLSAVMQQQQALYFHGSYIAALMAVFSDLDINPLGFKLDWSSPEIGIESVKYVLFRETPHLMREYQRLDRLSEREIYDLRNEIYEITYGHFKVWGLSAAMNQQITPYFYGSYINALIAVFPDLNLNPLGFKLDWSSEERGIESVKYVLSKEVPEIMQSYERVNELTDREIHDLRNAIYGIKQGHFHVWKLSVAIDQRKVPYFQGSYIVVLLAVFNHPRLGLTAQGFKDFRKATFEKKYSWKSLELGIWNVREAIRSNRPDIITSYENLAQLKENKIESLKKDIYGITQGHLQVWGLSGAMNQQVAPYFHGNYADVLTMVFSDLNLNPLGFQLDWSSEYKRIESVRYVLAREVPEIMQKYKRLGQLSERAVRDLRNAIYGITSGHFHVWGLNAAMNKQPAPNFHGSYINALIAVFPDLNLNPLGFQLDWSSEERGIESVKYVLSKEVTEIMQSYERVNELTDREIHDLRNVIYGITSSHFDLWGLPRAKHQQASSYFRGSYIITLLKVFPHPNLGLTREGFLEKTGSGGSVLMTENTRSEAVKRGMNPDGWIAELFFAPHYEFLNTFDTVRFFKSHREQTVGQAIGIMLIWGAMVATMIGAPFGLDFLLSGNPTAHIGYDLIVSFIASLSILSAVQLNRLKQIGYELNKSERIFFSIVYLSYPPNFLTHHLYNLISNLTRPLGKWRLAPLKVWRGIKQYIWKTRDDGIQNVRFVIKYYRPDIIERYDNIRDLSIYARKNLQDDIYKISQGHLILWGVYAALDKNSAPYFHGSYIDVLMAVFPKAELNPLGFSLKWSTQEQGIESMRFVLSQELPSLIERYDRLEKLSDLEIENLKEEIYQIKEGDFTDWGMGDGRKISNFGGGYIAALIALFPSLNLKPIGFRLRWETEEEGIESVKFVLTREIPYLMQRYNHLSDLTVREIQDFRNSIYSLKQGHFRLFGLIGVTHHDYFGRSYIGALLRVFDDPRLGLSESGFREFRRSNFTIRYQWDSIDSGISNIRDAFFTNRPDIIDRYEHLSELGENEKDALRNEIYRINAGYFSAWGLSSAMRKNYFNNSHIDALIAVFPNLELNRLGFQLDWSSEDRGIASVKFAISIRRLDLIERYDGLEHLNSADVRALREEFYKIKNSHFNRWGLSGAKNQKVAPYFKGSYIAAMITTFPKLNLNPLGFFEFDWSTEEQGIETIKFVLSGEYPSLIQRYERIEDLDPDEIVQLKDDIYEINQGHFQVWHLGGLFNKKFNPYFSGSYIDALIKVFPHPKLGLKRERFLEKTGSGGSVLMIENTRGEAVKRGMNPDGWIAQLFFSPHYEFLDTFDPVQFFKSHREQTVGQAIGIMLIWGAMAAAMIGAPFGVDYLLSGSPTAHLGHDLLASLIGALSIISGIQLKKFKQDIIHNTFIQTAYKINRTQKIILSIAYLSYPVNFLTHHLYNLISNFTRALGKWRLAPLTEDNGTAKTELYHWGTEEQGIENVRDALSKNRPELLERYSNLESLLPRERERERKSLKTEVYKISSSHFQYWGLNSALDRRHAPYFQGSYLRALKALFPELELEPLDIQLNWSNPDKAMESILYVLLREIPHLIQLYNRLPELDPAKVEALKNEIYQITSAHFDVWGLSNVGSKKHVPYFNGSHKQALMIVFADLDLNPLGFELDWASFEKGVESVLYVFKKHVPYLIERYERLNELTAFELNNLRREICAITKAHFTTWGLGSAILHRNAPYFNGSYKNILIAIFPKLNLNPLEFQLDWASRERALDSIRFVLTREVPHLLNQYDHFRDLSPRQEERLKDEIYKITSAHFDVWGLSNASHKRSVPYFNGSYIEALMAVFPDLDLNPLGFQLDWSSKQRAIDSIRFVIDREAPSLIKRYDHIERLSPGEIQRLRNNIYSITQAHFALWGLGRAQIRSSVPEFEGSYMKALVEVFNHPRLGVSLQGFSDFRKSTWEIKYSWQTVESGIFNVRDALMRNMPDLVMRYDQFNHLNESERNELRDDFYRITHAHFNLWGLSSATKRERAPYFNGTYSGALSVVFPDLNLNPLGFELDWSSKEMAIESLKFVFSKKRPDLIEQYDHRFQMNPHRIRALRNEIYGITYGHFMFWGLAGAINRNRAPYFNGSHVEALMALFPALHLNPLGFELSWSTKEKGIESVQFMLARGIPSIVQQYERVDELDEDGVEELKNRIYALDEADLKMWGLSRAMHMDSAPYFNGSYIEALIAVFSKLNLNSLGFKLDWSSKGRALDSVKFVLTQKVPHLMQLYLKIENLSDLELALLREGIYRIKRAHLLLWKLGGFFSDTTYFDDSIDLLINLFSHPKLGLTREGFAGQANNSSTSTDSSTDILEPLVQPLKRFKSWSSLGAYYLFTGSWEELLFRWGGVVGLPILFSSLGVNPILSQITGLVLSAVGFLFSHTILRWLVKRNSVDWHGWKTELKKDFFSLRTFHALLYNALFISIISFQPALVSFALGSVISLHFTIDMINAYKKKRLTPQELLSPEIQLIADELGTAESELKSLSFSSDLKFSDTVQILFGAWTIEPKVKKLYLADLTGVKDQGSQVALLRAIHEIYLANMNARFILVMEEPQSVKELESVLGVKGIVSVVSNPEEAIAQTKIILKQGSYAVGLIAGSGKIGIWSKLLDGLGKGVKEIRILVLQILDVGTTIKILLPQDRILNTNVKDWIKNLEAEGRIEQNGRELTIRGVPFEPPTPSEEHQLQTLFSSQA